MPGQSKATSFGAEGMEKLSRRSALRTIAVIYLEQLDALLSMASKSLRNRPELSYLHLPRSRTEDSLSKAERWMRCSGHGWNGLEHILRIFRCHNITFDLRIQSLIVSKS